MKKYAFYLPQYHEIPENNEWWGQGFTEWTNVKKAKPLYKNHIQPKVPLNNNYYSLNDINTLKWQAKLAKKYLIDGMIFYHYYFCGQKLLEKPAELLLSNKDIAMNFFFCWANHSWIKSWKGTKELLIEQKYGSKKDWEEHFLYLYSFFKDSRYLKINNKPVFMIFKSDFKEKEEYIKYLNVKCIEAGFDGIFMIETKENICERDSGNIFLREPATSLNLYRKSLNQIAFRIVNKLKKMLRNFGYNYIERFNGDAVLNYFCKKGLKRKNNFRGLCFEWDNTPRHGYRGYVITPPAKDTFMKYMDKIKDSDYVFINAWNEWGEGMMLEPTKEKGYKYLEWLKEWSEKNENRINGI